VRWDISKVGRLLDGVVDGGVEGVLHETKEI
jgi:hypothetical protein